MTLKFLARLILCMFLYCLTNHNLLSDSFTLKQKGVVKHDAKKSYDGINLIYSYWNGPSCLLFSNDNKKSTYIPGRFCEFSPGNGLFAITENNITLYDKNFEQKWSVGNFKELHHMAAQSYDGKEIFVLDFDYFKDVLLGVSIRSDRIFGYNLQGEKIFEWDSKTHIKDIVTAFNDGHLLDRHANGNEEFFQLTHINSINIIPPGLEKRGPAFKPGNILLSMGTRNGLLILDRATKKIVWNYKVENYCCNTHSASIVKNGNILFFKNFGFNAEKSEIAILDPIKKKEIWSYRGEGSPIPFISIKFGYAQELPNGNILATINPENIGAALEITPSKEIVWAWINPIRDNAYVPEVFSIKRLKHERIDDFKFLLE